MYQVLQSFLRLEQQLYQFRVKNFWIVNMWHKFIQFKIWLLICKKRDIHYLNLYFFGFYFVFFVTFLKQFVILRFWIFLFFFKFTFDFIFRKYVTVWIKKNKLLISFSPFDTIYLSSHIIFIKNSIHELIYLFQVTFYRYLKLV